MKPVQFLYLYNLVWQDKNINSKQYPFKTSIVKFFLVKKHAHQHTHAHTHTIPSSSIARGLPSVVSLEGM